MLQDNKSTVSIFFLNGINCILGWAAVLASLDFFNNCYPNYNVYSYIALPLFLGYLVVAFLYHQISIRYKYVTLIVVGNMTVNFGLVSMLLVSFYLPDSLVGFLVLQSICFMLGMGIMVSQLTFYAMINYLSANVVSKFTVGTGISSLFIACFRILFTSIYGAQSNSKLPIILYFGAAILFNTIDMVLNIYFCKSDIYISKIDPFLINKIRQKPSPKINYLNQIEEDSASQKDIRQETDPESLEHKHFFTILYQTSRQIHPYPLIIAINFVISITVFPALSMKVKIDNLPDTWLLIIYSISYSIGDMVGKLIAQLQNSFNHKSLIYLMFCKSYFLVIFSLMAKEADRDDPLLYNLVFPFGLQLAFGLTVGLCTNGCFILAYRVCPLAYKKYAGVLCGLAIQIGLMLGTIVQIIYSIILGLN